MDNGCYKLTWRERISFCSGDVAQNIIYQTVSIYELSDEKMDEINNAIALRNKQ